jgi:hypothetical protein
MLISSLKNRRTPWAFWLLLLFPVVLRLPFLLGWLDADPLLFAGGVGDSGRLSGGTPWIDPNVGFQAQALGKLAADQWLSGHVPWWNAFNGVGLPLAAEMQPGAFFLPFILLYHFRHGFMWVELCMQILAGLCTFALLRKIGLGRVAALTGGLLFELNGTFAWHGAPIATPIAFLPMLLLGVETLFERARNEQTGGWWLITLALAWSISAGFPETAYINGLLVAMWTLCRLPDLPRAHWASFTGKLVIAVGAGIACCLPLIVPFAEYVSRSFIGGHGDVFAHAALPNASAALSLMPALYGPIFAFNDPANAVLLTWSNIGGYLTLLSLALALLGGILAPRRLTVALLVWMALCLCKTYDLRPISDLMNMIPLIKTAAFFRYSPPSWEFAGIVLAAFGIDALQRGHASARRYTVVVFVIAACAAVASIWLARDPLKALLHVRASAHYVRAALGWLVISWSAGLILLLWQKRRPYAVPLLVTLLLVDATLAFVVPMRSGARHVKHGEPGLAFLRAHVGLQRAYGLGPLAPNYGAYFEVAQINHNYLPVSNDWLSYVNQHLDPAANAIVFNGSSLRAPGYGSAIDQLRERLPAYEEVGVRYVLASPGVNPFGQELSIQGDSGKYHSALSLTKDQSVTVHWKVPVGSHPRTLNQVGVLIGNYQGQSNGRLKVEVCPQQGACTSGSRPLSESQDDALFAIPLDKSLSISPDSGASAASLTIRFIDAESTNPMALWISGLGAKQAGTASMEAIPNDTVPTLALRFAEDAKDFQANQVYDGPDMSIYELAGAKPYFEITQGSCSLEPLARDRLKANCASAAQLLRREAFYPGWTAVVDGQPASLAPAHEIFEGVELGAGTHDISFVYRPSHYWILLAGFLAGIGTWLFGLSRELKPLRRRIH